MSNSKQKNKLPIESLSPESYSSERIPESYSSERIPESYSSEPGSFSNSDNKKEKDSLKDSLRASIQEKKIDKNKLLNCIENTSDNLGLTMGEYTEYMNKKYSINPTDYKSVYPKVPDVTISDGKTYITNLKVMLAQNLYVGSKMIKLNDKLSNILKISEPPIGWYISEKWDGIRAIWDGEKFVSRGQKVFTHVPKFFREIMPPGIALDGEIWIGRNKFSEVSGISSLKVSKTRTAQDIEAKWMGTSNETSVKYKVYDIPNSEYKFETRMKFLKQIVDDRTKLWKDLEYINECPIQFTEQTNVENMKQLVDTYKELTSKGAEGVMLRAPNSPYETKRSKYLLKYKIKDDAEALVKGYSMGTGKYKNMLGALECELLLDNKPTDIMFNIGTGFDDKDRKEYNNTESTSYIPIGAVVSFSYMEFSKDNIPRHPVYRGIREDYNVTLNVKAKNEAENEEENEEENEQENNDNKKSINVMAIEKGDKNYKSLIIDTFELLIKNEETQKEANWQFKRKAYKQVIDALSRSNQEIKSIEDALKILRDAGSKFQGEEEFFAKNGEYKNRTIQKIYEIIKKGSLGIAEQIRENPKVKAITELTKIPEIGPSKADKLYEDGITNIAELRSAYEKDDSLLNSKQVIGLKYYEDLEKRIPREEMDEWNKFFNEIMNKTIQSMRKKPEGIKLQMVGSYRRKAESSGDIDILISSNSNDSDMGKFLMKNFIKKLLETDYMNKTLVFSMGTTKFMGLGKIKDYYRHIDIFYYPEKEYPFALLFSTGSGSFNVEMRQYCIKQGYTLSEKELKYLNGTKISAQEYKGDIGKEYPTEEKDIFEYLGYKYIEPENRTSGIFTHHT